MKNKKYSLTTIFTPPQARSTASTFKAGDDDTRTRRLSQSEQRRCEMVVKMCMRTLTDDVQSNLSVAPGTLPYTHSMPCIIDVLAHGGGNDGRIAQTSSMNGGCVARTSTTYLYSSSNVTVVTFESNASMMSGSCGALSTTNALTTPPDSEATMTLSQVTSNASKSLRNFLSPTYATRRDQFRKLFKDNIPDQELFINDILSISKERTAIVIPNAIQVPDTLSELISWSDGGGDSEQQSSGGKRRPRQTKMQYTRLPVGREQSRAGSSDESCSDRTSIRSMDITTDVAASSPISADGAPRTDITTALLVASVHHAQSTSALPQHVAAADGASRALPPPTHGRSADDSHIAADIAAAAAQRRSRSPPVQRPVFTAGALPLSSPASPLTDNSSAQSPSSPETTDSVSSPLAAAKSSLIPPLALDDTPSHVVCGCATHDGRALITDELFSINADALFSLLFMDTPFARRFARQQQMSDVNVGAWTDGARTVTYTKKLAGGGNPLSPKQVYCMETQRIELNGTGGGAFVIACEVANTGVPYADSFVVRTRYCIGRHGDSARLNVHGCVVFIKSTWALMRALIEKPSMQGVEEYFVGLTMALHHEEQAIDIAAEETAVGDTSRSSKHRRQSAAQGATTPVDEDPFNELSEPNRTFLSTSKSSARASSSMNGVCACACTHTRVYTEYGTARSTSRRHSSTTPSPTVSDVWSAPRWLLIFIVCMLALNTLLLYRVYTSQHSHPPAHVDTAECDALLTRIAQQAQIDGGSSASGEWVRAYSRERAGRALAQLDTLSAQMHMLREQLTRAQRALEQQITAAAVDPATSAAQSNTEL